MRGIVATHCRLIMKRVAPPLTRWHYRSWQRTRGIHSMQKCSNTEKQIRQLVRLFFLQTAKVSSTQRILSRLRPVASPAERLTYRMFRTTQRGVNGLGIRLLSGKATLSLRQIAAP